MMHGMRTRLWAEKRMRECSRQRNQLCKDLEVRALKKILKINIIHYGRSRV